MSKKKPDMARLAKTMGRHSSTDTQLAVTPDRLVQMTIRLPAKVRARLRKESLRRQEENVAGWQLQQVMLEAVEAFLPDE